MVKGHLSMADCKEVDGGNGCARRSVRLRGRKIMGRLTMVEGKQPRG